MFVSISNRFSDDAAKQQQQQKIHSRSSSKPDPFFGRGLSLQFERLHHFFPVDNLHFFFNSLEQLTSTQRDSLSQDPWEPTQQRETENKANLQSLKKLKHVLW